MASGSVHETACGAPTGCPRSYFGQNVDGIVDRLMGEQLTDRWWNCKAERGSIRSSFNTAIEVLEGGGISRNQFEFGLDLILEALHRTANSSAG